MLRKIGEFIESFTIKFDVKTRILIAVLIATLIGGAILGSILPQEKERTAPEDTNVYLNEEVCFAGDIYIKVIGMTVDKIEGHAGQLDEDGDELSEFQLNLTLNVEQRTKKRKRNTEIKSERFTLKCVNLKSPSKMGQFFTALANMTLKAGVSAAIGGDINIIEETLNLADEYVTEVSENVETETKFKPIKAGKDQFEPFKPKEIGEARVVKISFPIKQEYLESENTIVLTIDSLTHIERRIFLITRPNTIENKQ